MNIILLAINQVCHYSIKRSYNQIYCIVSICEYPIKLHAIFSKV